MTIAPLSSIVRAALAAVFLTVGAGGIAAAQPTTPPSYAAPEAGETIRGHITSITGKYTLQIRDQRGYLDNITLHQGTIINPTGLTLQPGMQVTINGTNAGASFAANEIDTPYTVALVAPVYPYESFGFGWGPWGPRFGGGFGFWR